jgi:hypothetical protein
MFAAYRDAALDPELMSLRQDLVLIDARIIDVLKRVDTGEAGSIWMALRTAWARLSKAQGRGNVDGYQEAFADVARLVNNGVGDTAAWRDVGALINQRRTLVESEQKRLALAHEMMSQDQCLALVGQVIDIIRRHIPDRGVLHAIAQDVQALGWRGNGYAADADVPRWSC